jgi:hypothetical protein
MMSPKLPNYELLRFKFIQQSLCVQHLKKQPAFVEMTRAVCPDAAAMLIAVPALQQHTNVTPTL